MNEIIGNRSVSIKDYKEDFLDFIDVSEKTTESYNSGIKQFIKYLNELGISMPNRDDVINFRNKIKEEKSVPTANAYLSSLKAFFGYLEYNNIYKNITRGVKSLKDTTIHKRNYIPVEQCQELLNSCKNLREKFILSLALTTGVRINEIVNIRLEDIKVKNDKICIYVLGKGRDYKQDYVLLNGSVYEMMKQYIKEYNITDYLFVSMSNNNGNNKMTTNSMRRIVNKIFERVGIKNDKITYHSIRHSFATISILNGASTREVSQALRHTSTNVTERYLHDLEAMNNSCGNLVANNIIGGAI